MERIASRSEMLELARLMEREYAPFHLGNTRGGAQCSVSLTRGMKDWDIIIEALRIAADVPVTA